MKVSLNNKPPDLAAVGCPDSCCSASDVESEECKLERDNNSRAKHKTGIPGTISREQFPEQWLIASWGLVWKSSLIEELGVGLLLELAEVGVTLPDDADCFGRKAKDSEQVFTKRELQKVDDMDLMLVTLCEEEIPSLL
nr:hypothetical protein Iba_chr12fCG2360 [Ipomoea batatas]